MRVPDRLFRFLVAGLLLVLPSAASAVVIDRIGGGNTTAPFDDPGFNNVGAIWVGGGVYLGNGWVLTANHIGSGSGFTIGGDLHAAVPGTYHQLTNNGVVNKSTLTDLAMFQIQGPLPNLPAISIASTTPVPGDTVTMIGRGVDQQSDRTYWSVDTFPNPWVWTETTPGLANAAGFKTTGTQTMRWGTNDIDATGWVNDGWDVRGLRTQFDFGVPLGNEAQVVFGDSGGAVFAKQSGQWNLAGIILATDVFSGQPGGSSTAVFDSHSYFADLSFYRSQIVTIAVPEPAGLTQLFAAGLAGGAVWWVRRRSRP